MRLIGVSHSQTPNKIAINGQVGFLRCGADIFLTGLFQDLEGETKCPFCQGTISVEIKSRRITKLSPPTSLIHFVVIPSADPANFGIQCDKTFVFDQRGCLEAWLQTYRGPPGKILTPEVFLNGVHLPPNLAEQSPAS